MDNGGPSILLTSDTCIKCRILKQKFAEAIERGRLREVDANSEEGLRLVQAYNLKSVPVIIRNGQQLMDINEMFRIFS